MTDEPRRGRSLLVPLGCYLGVTLVLPALHGALARADFLRHAVFVVVGMGAVVGPVAAFASLLDVDLARARSSLGRTPTRRST
jgi:hypothetical protein